MIKIEINNEVTRIEMAGMDPHVYSEMGSILRRYHETLCESRDKEIADKLILALAKNAIMTEEEINQELERTKREHPATFLAAAVLAHMHREGGGDGGR